MVKKRRGNNEGSIYQRPNGTWCARVSVAGRRLTKYTKTQREARDWIKRTLGQIDHGLTVDISRIRVGEFLEHWLEMSAPSLRPKTIRQYRQVCRQYIVPEIGTVRLRDLRPDHLQALYNRKTAEQMSSRMVRLIHAILHRSLDRALHWGFLTRNVADVVDAPKLQRREMMVLQPEQARAFLRGTEGHRLEALFYLALSLGLRQGELLGLRWTDIDWSERVLHVQRQAQRVPGEGVVFVEPKTAAGRRTIALGENDLVKLRKHKRTQAEQRLFAGSQWVENGLVFSSKIGTPCATYTVCRAFLAILEAEGLPIIRFHDLRHTSATLQIAAGIPAHVVQRRLGHASIDMTLGTYSHVFTTMQQDAAERINDILK